MNTAKVYHNGRGEERTIHQMVRDEPYWAAERIQAGETAIEALKEYQKYNRIRNDSEAYCYELGEWALNRVSKKPNPENYGIEQ